ncbi:3-oxoacyl-[acyl-carrier protein] reductase [Gracilibacillus orientalis]|uniref:3-oxoacyl-[acyl-carrier protein] reductase n=1 Tax=Gracilibacillus orientalis TaxID=334253 RepID=A0A1I4PTT9_9BACI|nr:SDR family oxidoreductase [Gracilibacillus orientalis]SFM31188.1 3-oxoacyl-[acyl-carrier protein] reductase [Gracilibacillus orientalis]
MEKRTIITGASGEIGMAIANQLANKGHALFLHYNQNRTAIEQLQEQIPSDQIIDVIQSDLSTSEGLAQFIHQVPQQDIDQLIYTSGKSYFGLFQDMEEQDMDEMLQLHVKSPWKIAQALIPDMIRNKFGRIILISSIWGEIGASCEVAYSTVKGAQNAFIRALAKELGPSNIFVNGVSPGFIDTKMNQAMTAQEKQELIQDIPLQRAGKPEDVADAVQFLCSNQSKYIQGELIRVNGAWG